MSIIFTIIPLSMTYRRDLSMLFNRIAIIILIYCVSIGLVNLMYLNQSVGIQGGLINITSKTEIFQIFIFIITGLILLLTSFSFISNESKIFVNLRKYNFNVINENTYLFTFLKFRPLYKFLNKTGENLVEYPLILLFIITGGILLISTNDLFSVFLSIELQSYGLYLLSTVYRNSALSTSGSLIYFLLGGLSSSLILLGITLLYINSGTSNLYNLYVITNISNLWDINYLYTSDYINIALFIFSVGFLFKVSAAPFHFWSPDVYDSIPTIVTVSVAVLSKISIFIFLLDLVFYTNNYLYNNNWTYVLLLSSYFSLIIGTALGLTQPRIKKLLAYSTISHVGFLLLALSICSVESIQAFIFYLTQYSITNLNVFFILLMIGYYYYYHINTKLKLRNILDENNSPIQLISQLKGLFFFNPLLAISLTITIFSFAGIPPFMGFFAKQMVLSAAINSGFVFICLIAISTSIIGGVYYLNIIKEMFFKHSDYTLNTIFRDNKHGVYNFKIKFNLLKANNISYTHLNIKIPSVMSITISVICLIIVLFIYINREWLSMGTIMVQILYNF